MTALLQEVNLRAQLDGPQGSDQPGEPPTGDDEVHWWLFSLARRLAYALCTRRSRSPDLEQRPPEYWDPRRSPGSRTPAPRPLCGDPAPSRPSSRGGRACPASPCSGRRERGAPGTPRLSPSWRPHLE